MVSKEQLDELKTLRAAGVKRIMFHGGNPTDVEFFPLSLLDRVDGLTDNETPDERSERDTESPPADAGLQVPAAMARVLMKGSVS